MGYNHRLTLISLWIVALIASLAIGPANGANECVKNSGVASSINSIDDNTRVGGHVGKHVLNGKVPKSGPPVAPKSMFLNAAQFRTVWDAWVADTSANNVHHQCARGQAQSKVADCFKLGDNMKLSFKVCAVVQSNECRLSSVFPMKSVGFVYRRERLQRNGLSYYRWILLTAYPSMSTDCTLTAPRWIPKRS